MQAPGNLIQLDWSDTYSKNIYLLVIITYVYVDMILKSEFFENVYIYLYFFIIKRQKRTDIVQTSI